MNRKASEEKMQSLQQANGIMPIQGYNTRNNKPAYKSHLRGQDVPHQVGLNRNQSKPTLQLPDISSSGITGPGKNMQQI
jgi:hypothetical protein